MLKKKSAVLYLTTAILLLMAMPATAQDVIIKLAPGYNYANMVDGNGKTIAKLADGQKVKRLSRTKTHMRIKYNGKEGSIKLR